MNFSIFVMLYALVMIMCVAISVNFKCFSSKWFIPLFVVCSILAMPYFYLMSWGYGLLESFKVYLVLTAFLWVP